MYNFTDTVAWGWVMPETRAQVPVVTELQSDAPPNAAQITESTYSTLGPYTNWLLKHYSTYTDQAGFFGYRDSMDRDTDIKQILDHWLSDQGIISTSTAE
jgi:hypothetical protein